EAGWYLNPSSAYPYGAEIGDLAEGDYLKLSGYVVQAEWSASRNVAVLPSGWVGLTVGSQGSGGTGLEESGTFTGPIAYPHTYQGNAGNYSGLLASAYDPYGNPLTTGLSTGPAHGQVTLATD